MLKQNNPSMIQRKASEYVIDCLLHNNIDTFFLVTGGAIVPTVDYLGTKPQVKYYCFQHEQSAAMAAESYYRTTGKLGVVLSTSGPGAQNLLNGICGCWYESIPCLFITGQVSTYESIDSIQSNPRQLGFQEMPVVDSFRPFTKFIKKINLDTVNEDLHQAIISTFEGRPGPSLLDFPVNIQTSTVNLDVFDIKKSELQADGDTLWSIEILKNKLSTSKRPLLLLGHGIRLADAVSEIRELVNKLNIPFVVSWGGFDLINHDHSNFIGAIGVYGSRGGNFAIQNCDLLISIGSRLDTRQTGGDLKTFSRDSYKVMVDIDSNELHKGRGLDIDLPINCDAKIFINSCLDSLTPIQIENEWKQYCSEWQNLNLDKRELKSDVLTSYEFLEELNIHLPEDSIVIPDEGGHLVWSMQSLKAKTNQRIFSNFGNSSMGYGLPAAIGAAIDTNKQVICIDGDGGFQMNIQELQTVKHYKLPIKIFIMNNSCYGIIKQFQDAYFDSRYTATESHDYSVPDFIKIANAYGIKAIEANKNNYKDVINLALQEEGSILVNVVIDREQKLTPKLEFGNPLEDMSPYLDDKSIQDNMIIPMIPRKDNTQGWVTLNK
jgi:acetolactate synthase I/II/III large subunit